VRAIILSAGQPVGFDQPAFDIKIDGTSVGEIQAACLRSCGIEDITYVLGYGADKWSVENVHIVKNADWNRGGSVSSLAFMADVFDGRDDVLIAYGDTIFEPNVVRELEQSAHSLSAVCYLDRRNDDRQSFREFAQIQDGWIGSVTASPSATKGIRTVFTGLVLVRRNRAKAVRRYLKEWTDPAAHVGAFIDYLIAHGVDVAPVPVETGWAEVTNQVNLASIPKSEVASRFMATRTDWSARAIGYNHLQWVNDDGLLRSIVGIALMLQPRRVLDLGTGTGKVLLGLRASLGGGEFWGVDSSEAMLAKMPKAPDVRVICDDAETLSRIPENYFDLITARMVFHHVRHPLKAARAAVRSLVPGGHFLICEGVPPTHRAVDWYTEMFRYKEDRNTITEGDLAHVLTGAGLEDVQTHSIVMRRASLNNWLDNAGLPAENVRILKDMHFNAPSFIKDDYEMEFANGDCLMTWRFAVTFGRLPQANEISR
jgi:SAM-dependent methyltransferase/choline kinase